MEPSQHYHCSSQDVRQAARHVVLLSLTFPYLSIPLSVNNVDFFTEDSRHVNAHIHRKKYACSPN